MSHTISGDGTGYPGTFDIPDDGDDRDAASFNVAIEALADRTEYLSARVVTGTASVHTSALTVDGSAAIGNDLVVTDDISCNLLTCDEILCNGDVVVDGGNVASDNGFFQLNEKTVTVVIDGGAETDAGSGWELNRSTNDFFWQTTSTSQSRLRIPLNAFLQNGDTITQLVARFDAAGGHGALPGGLPELILYRKRIGTTGAASGIIDSEFDPSANTTAFQAEHDIQLVLSSPHTVNLATHAYYAVLASESGSDAAAGAQYHGLKLTYTYSRVDRT